MTGALQGFYQNFRSFAVAAVEVVATGNKVIFGYGGTAADLSITNLVSNTGVQVMARIKLYLDMDLVIHHYQ